MVKDILQRKYGFSLLELMVVIGIIGLLATIVLPRLTNKGPWARLNTFAQQMANTIRKVGDTALIEHTTYRIVIEPQKHTISAEYITKKLDSNGKAIWQAKKFMAPKIPFLWDKNIVLENIFINGKDELQKHEITTKIYIYISHTGIGQPTIINSTDRATRKKLSLKINPFTLDSTTSHEYQKT